MFTFIESSAFERVCPVYLDDDEYAELQQFMMQNPEAGQVVSGMSFGCWRSTPRLSETVFLRTFSGSYWRHFEDE
jgi:hypothetical protein